MGTGGTPILVWIMGSGKWGTPISVWIMGFSPGGLGGSPYQCVLGTPPGGNGVPFTPLAISATPRRFGDPPGMTAPHSPPLYSHRCAVTVGCKSPFWRQCCKQRSASGGAPPPPPPPAPTGSAPSRHCRARPRRTRSDGSAYSFLSVRKETEGLWGDVWGDEWVMCGVRG